MTVELRRVDLRRGADRARTDVDGCDARHGFSFGAHYDPANTFFGALLAHNDERLAPGCGYPTHTHREADLVTWVVAGTLRHTDSLGTDHELRPGTVQVLASGTGVEHAEFCAGEEPVRFVQAWLVPDAVTAPALHTRDVSAALSGGRPFAVPLPLRRADAALWAARLPPGATWTLPEAPYRHVFVAAGSTDTPAGEVGEGDELRLTTEDGAAPDTARATMDTTVLTAGARGAEVLVWLMGSDLRPPGA
ncbi:pirin-like bicupin family protein [Pseudonocardia ailaonensis]|uniref:Pirin-like bicupin family protein n=1 Tax=Pseudonocardia ailaonensis TaxID=367279 RepID=A0ABN2N914_9PSEU